MFIKEVKVFVLTLMVPVGGVSSVSVTGQRVQSRVFTPVHAGKSWEENAATSTTPQSAQALLARQSESRALSEVCPVSGTSKYPQTVQVCGVVQVAAPPAV
jgi:hypothetical protein